MHLTAKVKIYPTEDQLKVLWELSDRCCSLYNLALADRKDAWKSERKTIKYVDQQNKLPEFKKRNPEYKTVYSKTLQGILKKLDANYRSFFGLRKNGYLDARPPNYKNRKYFQTIPYNQSGFYQARNWITFSHKVNDTELVFDFYIDRDRNSAINIMYNFLSQNALWTSLQFFSANLRQTGFPMELRFLGLKPDDENTRRKLLPQV